jgi:hypothetical protein
MYEEKYALLLNIIFSRPFCHKMKIEHETMRELAKRKQTCLTKFTHSLEKMGFL